jgi:uncharacterized surface protein with fasciclin (FAS1) repeats
MKIQNRHITRVFAVLAFTFLLAPVQAQTVIEQLKKHSETVRFAEALENSDLQQKLNSAGPFTLFAPSNEAFAEYSGGKQVNESLLLNHVFMGMATERSLTAMSDITCLSGKNLTIEANNRQKLSVNSIIIITSNIRAQNGVIHIIDGVIE